MTKAQWIQRITEACRQVGTYKEPFDDVIETLADILSRRDAARVLFKKSGKSMFVDRTTKSGQTDVVLSPVMRLIDDLDRDALAYWRDLGLTPAGLRKLSGSAEAPPTDPLAAALSQLRVVQ